MKLLKKAQQRERIRWLIQGQTDADLAQAALDVRYFERYLVMAMFSTLEWLVDEAFPNKRHTYDRVMVVASEVWRELQFRPSGERTTEQQRRLRCGY